MKKVLIIDYGAGNLKSITKSVVRLDLNVEIFSLENKSSIIKSADIIVFPGVGEFGSAMKVIEDIKPEIFQHIRSGKPILGICLGLQILFDTSEEDKNVAGLGILKGKVVKFKNYKDKKYPVPHMCWNKVVFSHEHKILLKKLCKEEYFYFVHSYYPVPEEQEIVFGETEYSEKFCSMVVKNNIVATQFHIEKSGSQGLVLLNNIIEYFKRL